MTKLEFNPFQNFGAKPKAARIAPDPVAPMAPLALSEPIGASNDLGATGAELSAQIKMPTPGVPLVDHEPNTQDAFYLQRLFANYL